MSQQKEQLRKKYFYQLKDFTNNSTENKYFYRNVDDVDTTDGDDDDADADDGNYRKGLDRGIRRRQAGHRSRSLAKRGERGRYDDGYEQGYIDAKKSVAALAKKNQHLANRHTNSSDSVIVKQKHAEHRVRQDEVEEEQDLDADLGEDLDHENMVRSTPKKHDKNRSKHPHDSSSHHQASKKKLRSAAKEEPTTKGGELEFEREEKDGNDADVMEMIQESEHMLLEVENKAKRHHATANLKKVATSLQETSRKMDAKKKKLEKTIESLLEKRQNFDKKQALLAKKEKKKTQ